MNATIHIIQERKTQVGTHERESAWLWDLELASSHYPIVLHGIAFKESGYWIAQCETIDHVAQADSLADAVRECIQGVFEDLIYAVGHQGVELVITANPEPKTGAGQTDE